MKILVVHNFYRQPGGEDQVFRTESALLEEHGHEVIRETIHNEAAGGFSALVVGAQTIWNQNAYRRFEELVGRERPQVVHFHNTFPRMSPAVYYASRKMGAAVVQTLHNYRLVCPGATMFREGSVCEKCLTRGVKWPAVQHGCYRGSRLASAATAAMLATHEAAGTWQNAVDAYIAISGFLADKVIAGGLPASKVHVKPNCLHPDPGLGARGGEYALFLGRLSTEKGIETLLEAWREIGQRLPLKIAGDGPLSPEVERAAREIPGVQWLGQQNRAQVFSLLHEARCLVVPSVWYEGGIPLTGLEALAAGVPVIASQLGSMERHLEHRRTALLFAPRDPAGLVAQVNALLADPALERRLSSEGRREFERHFTAQRTYERLLEIYEGCLSDLSRNRLALATA